jgi:rare lipoprotein A (peptidoglycan hydrolase)
MAALVTTVALAITPTLDFVGDLERAPTPSTPAPHHQRPRPRPRRDPPPPMQTALASYYYDPPGSGNACGFVAQLGVASRTVPCGTRVRICATSCATAIVDDRGPYIYDRLWDLSVGLAQTIGFDFGAGVALVKWVIV